MDGKELLLTALRRGTVGRPPWVPFVGVHGGALIGVPADTYLRSVEHIVAGQGEAIRRYRPDGIPVVFDLQLEAEALGCELVWSSEVSPSVVTHPLAGELDPDRLPDFDLAAGRLPIVLEAARRLSAEHGDAVALYGLVCGPFTLAMHLAGTGLFLHLFDDDEGVRRLLERCAAVCARMAEAWLAAGCEVIAVVDPLVSQISAEHAASHMAPHAERVCRRVRELGGVSSIFVCGDATRNLEVLCGIDCDNVSVDENVDLAVLAEVAERHGRSFGGNLRLTTALLLGDAVDAEADAVACLDAGGGTGHILSPGCDLPYAVPPANLEAISAVVHDRYRLEVARRTAVVAEADDYADVVLPDYADGRCHIDIVTLDSASCPPCRYMRLAVEQAGARFGDAVDWHERKITGREGLGFMHHLGVAHIPSICINGAVRFASLIPDADELDAAIRATLPESLPRASGA